MLGPVFMANTMPALVSSPQGAVDNAELLRLGLAQEFRTLASLRHPHIISVLDYGFDSEQQPYFTMELLSAAAPLLEGGQKLPRPLRFQLLLQLLNALMYLHRRGVLHRDIKPANILLTGRPTEPHAKLLDFGLATLRQQAVGSAVSGTLGYIAPEILRGHPPSELADLYAFGVVAYELLIGQTPSQSQHSGELAAVLRERERDLGASELAKEVQAVLSRLLSEEPSARFASAQEAAVALAQAGGLREQRESVVVRESFLQAAEFVGRSAELEQLQKALQRALRGSGSAWVVGGESGVGKSRLLDELRILTLVAGARVFVGQATSDGGTGFALLSGALRALSLQEQLSEVEASVLKSLLPDLPTLLGRPIPDAPALDPQPTQLRLVAAIESVLLGTTTPTVILLEDLHWCDPDSMEVLRRLTPQLGDRPLLLVASYRDEERPHLPRELPAAQLLRLSRLSQAAVAQLSTSMLGGAAKRAELVEWLQQQTEGNTYFMVEVVRALAQDAGTLAAIGQARLPTHILTGGMGAMLQRRLERVPADALHLLRRAAVAGRQLDLTLLRAMVPDLEPLLRECAEAAILEVFAQQWRFSHDKLREHLLTTLGVVERQQLHHEVALGLERAYPDPATQAAARAYHYEQAGIIDKAAVCAVFAGQQAARRGSLSEAAALLTKAAALQQLTATPRLTQVQTRRLLVDTLFALGQMDACVEVIGEALTIAGHPMPRHPLRLGVGLAQQIVTQALHRVFPRAIDSPTDPDAMAMLKEVVALHKVSLEVYVWQMKPLPLAYVVMDGLNVAERTGDPALCRSGYAGISYMLSVTPLAPLGDYYLARCNPLDGTELPPAAQLYSLRGATAVYLHQGDAVRHRACMEVAQKLAQQLGDVNAELFLLSSEILMTRLKGNFEDARRKAEQLVRASQSCGNMFFLGTGYGQLGTALLHIGDLFAAERHLDSGVAIAERERHPHAVAIEDVRLCCALRRGHLDKVRQLAPALLKRFEDTPATFVDLQDACPGVARTLLVLWQAATQRTERHELELLLQRALRLTRGYARAFRVGQPSAWLLTGHYQYLRGERESAWRSFAKSRRIAVQLGMPFEAAQAQAWLGRITPGVRGHGELTESLATLQALGAPWESHQVADWLAESAAGAAAAVQLPRP